VIENALPASPPPRPLADAHADSLMWNRDLNVASTEGHVDFPRLREAGARLQCFTVVTRGLPVIDGFSTFARSRGWPAHARASEWTRCTWQLDRLAHFCRQSEGTVSIAGTRAQLLANQAAQRLSAVVGIEGAHALEGKAERVQELWERGVRFMSLTHLANNELGGTSTRFHGDRPLTPLGRAVLEAMAAAGMSLDLAHAAPAMLPDLLAYRGPVFISHTGVAGVKPLWRNVGDEVLRTLAGRGGVVGIIFAPRFLGARSLAQLVRHLTHAVQVMGEDAVTLGSDFDGMIRLADGLDDARDLPRIAQALLEAGQPERVVDKLCYQNLHAFFARTLP
jgi:membrane dipeptidase